MLIRRKPDLTENDVIPQCGYCNRRVFLAGSALIAGFGF
jgi:hypothetical protein